MIDATGTHFTIFVLYIIIMQKNILLFIFFIFSCYYSSAQSARFATRADFKTGLSIPVGTYAAGQLPETSFALNGIAMGLMTQTSILPHWEIIVQSGLMLHSVDVSALGYEKVKNDPFLEDVTIRSDPFRIIHLIAGPMFHAVQYHRFTVSVNAQAGVFFSKTPYQLYKPKYFIVGPTYYEVTSASDASFAYGAGIVASFKTNSCILLSISAEYLSTKAIYGFISSGTIRQEKRPLSMVNISVGVSVPLF